MSVEQVREFHEAAGEDTLDYMFNTLKAQTVSARRALVEEESWEVHEALEDLWSAIDRQVCDEQLLFYVSKVAKEIADLQYVVDGTILALGLADVMPEVSKRVHENNMSKVKDGVIRNENGKIMKPDGYEPVYLGDLFSALIGIGEEYD